MNTLFIHWGFWGHGTAVLAMLLEAAAKSVLVLAVTGLLSLFLRRQSAAVRHALWLAAVASLPVLPFLSLALPGWPILPSWLDVRMSVKTPAAHPARATLMEAGTRSVEMSPPNDAVHHAPHAHRPLAPVPAAESQARPGAASIALSIWLAGVMVCLLPVLVGLISLRHVQKNARALTDPGWLGLLRSAAATLGCRRRVTLLASDRRRMPMTWGWLRPRLLVPGEADSWPLERRRLVLLHEVAHVKRHDFLANLITEVACALYWFNPLVWLARRAMVAERERACDDLVLRQGATPVSYAEQLLMLASGGGRSAGLGIAMARPSKIERRLVAILDPTRKRGQISSTVILGAVALLLFVVTPASMLCAAAGQAKNNRVQSGRFVRLVVDRDKMTFQGQPVSHADLRRRLEALSNKADTVLEMAAASPELAMEHYLEAHRFAARLVEQCGLKYLSEVGIQEGHDQGSHSPPPPSSPQPRPESPQPGIRKSTVRLLINTNAWTFQGLTVRPDEMEKLLKKVPHPQQTVLELAVGSAHLPVKSYWHAQALTLPLVQRLGFSSFSFVGLQENEIPPAGQISKAPTPPQVPRQLAGMEEPQMATSATQLPSQKGPRQFTIHTLLLPSEGQRRFLSLEDLQLHSAKPNDAPVVYLHVPRQGQWQVVIENAYNYHTEKQRGMELWQTMSADAIAAPAGLPAVPFERTGFYELRPSALPITALVPEWGLLQFSGIDEPTQSVILHYKRVR